MPRVSNGTFADARDAMKQAEVRGTPLEIAAELAPAEAPKAGFELRKGHDEETVLGFSPETKEVFHDRNKPGLVSYSADFPGRHKARVRSGRSVKLHVFVDRSSVEVFVNDGEAVLTDRIYPALASDGLELYSHGGQGRVLSLKIWQLKPVWR